MRHPVSVIFLFALTALLAASAQQPREVFPTHQEFLQKLVEAAIERTHHIVRYDSAYVRIPYPNGDVPAETGVCWKITGHYRYFGPAH